MTVKPETLSGIVISKWRDEGSASPAVARLMLGIQRLRDMVFTDEKRRKEFDVPYQFVLETIMNTRATAKQITQLVNEHSHKVSKGEIAQLVAGAIRLSEDINSDLQRLFAEFLNSAVRVAKDGMQNLLSLLGLNIGFLFQQQGTFEEGLRECARDHPELAAYLHETRKWSEPLILLRNNLHKGWMLPKMTYKQANVTVQAMEPQISGRAASDFVNYTADRLCCFVEEVLVHSLQAQMPSGLSITEIPISDRKVVSPERFQVTFVKGGMPIWTIAYHDSIFEET
jgi:hypothetical protein